MCREVRYLAQDHKEVESGFECSFFIEERKLIIMLCFIVAGVVPAYSF